MTDAAASAAPPRRLRILFIHQHYYPETVGTSTRLVEIAEHLVARGHEVTAVTGIPSHPSTMRSAETPRRQPHEEQRGGVRVIRTWTFGSRGPDTFWRRMLAYGSFMLTGGWRALRLRGRFDVLVAVSPLPNGIAGVVVSRLRSIPLMFDVCDIWPDCAMAVGMLESPLLVGPAKWVEKRIYANSVRVGVVTRGFTENLAAKGVPREKVRLLPDWVDPVIYNSDKVDRDSIRGEYDFGDRFVVSFLGNFGLIMGLEQILETASLVQERDPQVLFVFVGKGVALPMMEEFIKRWGLENVRILPYQPREKVPALLAASDALIVTYRKSEITQITVPSKIYEYMSSARPVVAGVDGVIAEILSEAGCGYISRSRDPQEMADAVLRLKADPAGAARLGSNGRAYAMRHFTFAQVAADYEQALLETAEGLTP